VFHAEFRYRWGVLHYDNREETGHQGTVSDTSPHPQVEDLDLNAEPNVDIGETATDPEPEPQKMEEPDLHLAPASAEESFQSRFCCA
ncbi:hypothetical protein BaRGS_00039416, partial [Batillaria attramentaria]